MATDDQRSFAIKKAAVAKFPLRLMPSVRRTAEIFSQKEGVSLNQFINVAVAEKLAHLEHEEWVRNRLQPSKAVAQRVFALLQKTAGNTVEPGDELPETHRARHGKGSTKPV